MLSHHSTPRGNNRLSSLCATWHSLVLYLWQSSAPLEVAHKQVLHSTVGAAGQQHGDGLPVVAVAVLGLHSSSSSKQKGHWLCVSGGGGGGPLCIGQYDPQSRSTQAAHSIGICMLHVLCVLKTLLVQEPMHQDVTS